MAGNYIAGDDINGRFLFFSYRKTSALILIILFLTGCLSFAKIYYEPGIYEGIGKGYRGIIKLQVSLSEGGIEDIEIVEQREDAFAVEALEELRELALEIGSSDLDAISGATVSSAGFISALEAALTKGSSRR